MHILVHPPIFLGVSCFKEIHRFLKWMDHGWPKICNTSGETLFNQHCFGRIWISSIQRKYFCGSKTQISDFKIIFSRILIVRILYTSKKVHLEALDFIRAVNIPIHSLEWDDYCSRMVQMDTSNIYFLRGWNRRIP